MRPSSPILRAVALTLALLLTLPSSSFGLREIQTVNSGLEERELAAALQEDRPAGMEEKHNPRRAVRRRILKALQEVYLEVNIGDHYGESSGMKEFRMDGYRNAFWLLERFVSRVKSPSETESFLLKVANLDLRVRIAAFAEEEGSYYDDSLTKIIEELLALQTDAQSPRVRAFPSERRVILDNLALAYSLRAKKTRDKDQAEQDRREASRYSEQASRLASSSSTGPAAGMEELTDKLERVAGIVLGVVRQYEEWGVPPEAFRSYQQEIERLGISYEDFYSLITTNVYENASRMLPLLPLPQPAGPESRERVVQSLTRINLVMFAFVVDALLDALRQGRSLTIENLTRASLSLMQSHSQGTWFASLFISGQTKADEILEGIVQKARDLFGISAAGMEEEEQDQPVSGSRIGRLLRFPLPTDQSGKHIRRYLTAVRRETNPTISRGTQLRSINRLTRIDRLRPLMARQLVDWLAPPSQLEAHQRFDELWRRAGLGGHSLSGEQTLALNEIDRVLEEARVAPPVAAGLEEPTDAEMEEMIWELSRGSDQARGRALETIRKWVGRPDGLPELPAIPSSQVDASTMRLAQSYAEDLRQHSRAFLQAAERLARLLTIASRPVGWSEPLPALLDGVVSDWKQWGSAIRSYAEAWSQWIARFRDSLEALATPQDGGNFGETRSAELITSWRKEMEALRTFSRDMTRIQEKLSPVIQRLEAIGREAVSLQPAPVPVGVSARTGRRKWLKAAVLGTAGLLTGLYVGYVASRIPTDGDDPFLEALDAHGGRIPVLGLMYVNSEGAQCVLPNEIAGHRAIQPRVPRDLLDLRSAQIASGIRIFDRVGLPAKAIPPGAEVVRVRELNRESLADIRNPDALFVNEAVDLEALLAILPEGVRPAMVRIAASEAAKLSRPGSVEALIREAERRQGRFLDVEGVTSYKGREIAILGEAA